MRLSLGNMINDAFIITVNRYSMGIGKKNVYFGVHSANINIPSDCFMYIQISPIIHTFGCVLDTCVW